ncbi:MAG TPA: SDR family NAD(P)-dependent oxidoreductase [Acidimicrobiales bacterium]
MTLERVVDAALEATVAGSFTRLGYEARRALGSWDDEPDDLAGRVVLVTGATSGIGQAAVRMLARRGATVRMLARDEGRAERACKAIVAEVEGADVDYGLADIGDFEALKSFAATFAAAHPRLDALVHNAGALVHEHQLALSGDELTVATHVLGPFLLTHLLLTQLKAASPGRVVTVSSGGMYTQRFDLDGLEMDPQRYDGTTAYARAKRAQVVLTHEWARRVPPTEVVFNAMHPGWADTPGVRTSLPGFFRVMRPLLRTPEQGADTAVWLATAPAGARTSGAFWHDRRVRGEHHLPWTRGGDDPARLWEWCVERTGGPE